MVVLRPTEVDNARADLHTVEFTEGIFGTGVVNVFTESETTRIGLARFLDQMEALQTTVPLQ